MNTQTVDVEIKGDGTVAFLWDWNGDVYMSQFECKTHDLEQWIRDNYWDFIIDNEDFGEWDADEDSEWFYIFDFDKVFAILNKQYNYNIGAEFLASKIAA